MTREEAKDVFLNRGFVMVNGGEVFDGDKWRQSVVVISELLEQEPREKYIKEIDHLRKYISKLETQNVEQENADGCCGCAFEDVEEWEMPCSKCKRNCKDYFRRKE